MQISIVSAGSEFDAERGQFTVPIHTYKDAALVNVIPAQRAGTIAIDAGLAGNNGYCTTDPFSMRSQIDKSIFVLGDAAVAGDMPKSAFAAGSQAAVVARAIAAELLGNPARPNASYANKCWSLIAASDSVFVGGRYGATPNKIKQVTSEISTLKDTPASRRFNYEDSASWYSKMTDEMFARV
ncbi:MAG: sulfide dehydrogenase [flavocytochrome c] flavoprotein subunit [Alphaproteobacteria bacterium]|jgi:sulfide dehydrogenase [flavocytochrome c] flavoprotein subunit